MKPNKAENYVLAALKTNKRARTSDFILYGSVLKRMGLNLDMTLKEFLQKEKTGLACQEICVGTSHYQKDPSVTFRMLKLTKPCKTTGQNVLMLSLGLTHEILKNNKGSILPTISTVKT